MNMFGVIVVLTFITPGFSESINVSMNTFQDSHHHPVVNFLADFLLNQSSSIAPAVISVYSSFQEGRATLRHLSERGLAAQLFTSRGPGWTLQSPEGDSGATEKTEIPPSWTKSLTAESHRNDYGYEGSPHASSIVLDLTCPAANGVLQMADGLRLFAAPFRWLLVEPRMLCSEEKLLSLTPVSALIDSHVSVACWSPEEEMVQVFEVYRPARNASPVIQRASLWKDQKLQMQLLRPISACRQMYKHPIVLGIVMMDNSSVDPWNGIQGPIENNILVKSVYMPTVLAAELINASIKHILSDTHGYKRLPNGSMPGIIGGQLRREVDVCVCPNGPTLERLEAQRYLMFPTVGRTAFTFRAPSLSYETNVFGMPFPRSLWIVSTSSILVCCFLVWLAIRAERYIKSESRSQDENWADVLLLGLGAVCQQGSTMKSYGEVGRILVFLLFLSVLFLYTSYTASIVVLFQSTSKSIRTREDLWKSRLDVGATYMPYNRYYFSKNATGIGKLFYEDKISGKGKRKDNFLTFEEALPRVRKGLFAFHSVNIEMYRRIQETFYEHEKCDVMEIGGFPPMTNMEMSTGRGSHISEIFKIRMMIISETGLRLRFAHKHVPSRPNKCSQQVARFSSVGIVDLRASYYVLFGGFAVSVVIGILEHTVFQAQHRAARRRIQRSKKQLPSFYKQNIVQLYSP